MCKIIYIKKIVFILKYEMIYLIFIFKLDNADLDCL